MIRMRVIGSLMYFTFSIEEITIFSWLCNRPDIWYPNRVWSQLIESIGVLLYLAIVLAVLWTTVPHSCSGTRVAVLHLVGPSCTARWLVQSWSAVQQAPRSHMCRNWGTSPDPLSESVKVEIFQIYGMKYWGKFEYVYIVAILVWRL